LDEAIMAFEQALALDPQHYWANGLLAGIYAERREWEAAVRLERVALETAPDDEWRVASGIRLARAYGNLGDRENACVVLKQIQPLVEQGDTRIKDLLESLECQR
jgi:tetratricopeptide (TPR) repeat protein